MELHHGQTVERIIRRNGFNITELARLTKVNRRSVYNWFNQRHLKPQIIYRIGSVINYDFSSEFPGMFSKEDFMAKGNSNPSFSVSEEQSDQIMWKDKYIELLERHNQLLQVYLENKTT